MATYSTFEQFARFGTDATALERMLRMIQAFLQILSCYFVPRALLLSLVSLAKPGFTVDRAVVLAILDGFRSRVALARRFFRVFRFLESFQAAYRLYSPSSPSTAGKPAEIWLDILGRSFNGMYLLLETSTLLDVMGVPGFSLLGAELLPRVNVEAQRFWFLALVCGVAGGLVRLVKTFVYAGVPDSGEGFGDGSGKAKEKAAEGAAAAGTEEKTGGDGDEEQDGPDAWRKERERMRQALRTRRLERRRLIARIRIRLSGLLRRLVADVCDLPVPGAVIGWIPVDQGTVGVLMVVSTYLTGLDAWERCGREVAATKAEGN